MRGRSAPFLDGYCSAHDSILGPISGPETVPIFGPAMRYPKGRYTSQDPLYGGSTCWYFDYRYWNRPQPLSFKEWERQQKAKPQDTPSSHANAWSQPADQSMVPANTSI